MNRHQQHVVINGRVFFRIGNRLIPAVSGGSGAPAKEGEDKPDPEPALTRDEVQSMITGAFKDAQRRTERAIVDGIAKAMESVKPAPAPEPEPAKGKGDKGESEQAKQIADLKARLDKAEKDRAAEAEARRRDLTHAQLRQLLEGKDVRKEALDYVVTAMANNGTLRFDEDGTPMLAVKRSRTKGAAAEEQLFDDLKAGVEDWAKTEVAAVFIKAPASVNRPTGNNGTGNNNGNRSPAVIASEMSEEAKVSTVADLLRDHQ